jgi:FkbM family methyltransferase
VAIHTEGVGYMIIEIPDTGIKFDLRDNYDSDPIVVREIWEENVYEVNDGHFNRGGVVVDLGANIGTFSIYSAFKGSKVYAVEPEPHNAEALNNNIILNNMQDLITHIPYGVSDKKGTAVITDMGGGASIKDDGMFGTEIELMSLDSLFGLYNIDEVDILKIDVEGSEPEIILGASKENLQKCKYITMEFDHRTGNRIGEMTQKLSETHHVRTMGSWERGGMIWAWIY